MLSHIIMFFGETHLKQHDIIMFLTGVIVLLLTRWMSMSTTLPQLYLCPYYLDKKHGNVHTQNFFLSTVHAATAQTDNNGLDSNNARIRVL